METYSRIIKGSPHPDRRTLVIRQKLLQPAASTMADKESNELQARNDPVFPLYLGESDDILEVDEVEVFQYKEELTEIVDSILPAEAGIRPTSMYTTAFLPIAFKRGKRDWAGVDYRSYYVGPQLTLEQPIRAVAAGKKRCFDVLKTHPGKICWAIVGMSQGLSSCNSPGLPAKETAATTGLMQDLKMYCPHGGLPIWAKRWSPGSGTSAARAPA